LPAAAIADSPNDLPLERGFRADSAFQLNDLDHIDLFRGTLAIVIPLGQRYRVSDALSYGFQLTYSNEIWDINDEWGTDPLEPVSRTAELTRHSNAGVGWVFSLGMFKGQNDPEYPGPGWRYVSPDGAEHQFHETLHDGETPNPPYLYTRDGSYMRLKLLETSAQIEMPDGTKHTFFQYDPNNDKWRLTNIADRWGNSLSVSYVVNTAGQMVWTVTDTVGRKHVAVFAGDHKHLVTLKLAAFGDEPDQPTAEYSFAYEFPRFFRSCLDSDDENSVELNVPPIRPGEENYAPFLMSVTQPDGSMYKMRDDAAVFYETTYTTQCQAGPGALTKLILPTGGALSWSYVDYSYAWEEPVLCGDRYCAQLHSLTWPGVSRRRIVSALGATEGTWTYSNVTNATYSPSTTPENLYSRPEERRMVVTAPDGNTTVHYFRAYPHNNIWMEPAHKRDYGLNYTRRVEDPFDAGRFLSTQYFRGAVTFNETDGSAQGDLLRSEYRSFQLDSYDPGGDGYRHFNRHLKSEQVYFHDDPTTNCGLFVRNPDPPPVDPQCHWKETVRASFDGLGHFRQESTNGSFAQHGMRTATTNYNPGKNYPPQTPPAEWWPSTSPWIIGSYTYTEACEAGSTARQEYCFDTGTGSLDRIRTLAAGTSRAAHDLLVEFTRNASGNLQSEEYYGGDTQAVSTTLGCDDPVSLTPQYRKDHTYSHGVRATSQYIDADGQAMPFKSLDCDVDQATGLYSACRDTAEKATSFVYDALGRLTWEKPSEGAFTRYEYLPFNPDAAWDAGTNVARVEVCTRPNGSGEELGCQGSAYTDTYTRSAYRFDGLGRLFKESTRLPGSSLAPSGNVPYEPNELQAWNQRLTTYDSSGRKAWVSEWQPNGTAGDAIRKTSYLNYDPFGRVGTIRPPDGAAHDVTFAYTGARLISRTTKIATSHTSGGDIVESPSTTTEEYDLHGRLHKVTEPSGEAGASVTTTYGYDVGNRLTSVSTTAGSTTQSRSFLYDNRGFLLFEDLPEKTPPASGRSGYCATHDVCYSGYDAKGHAGRIDDGDHVLLHAYDRAERPLTVKALLGSAQAEYMIKELTYDELNEVPRGDSLGKLVRAIQHNRHDPANPSADFAVTEDYDYSGLGGRVSSRTTQVSTLGTCQQGFTWGPLGDLASVTYPTCGAVGTPRAVDYTYESGLLTSVKQSEVSIADISYHTNTMVNAIEHRNGVTVTHGLDPHAMRRPASIATSGVTGTPGNWDSGTYTYDGAGNITGIGDMYYLYDPVSRLKRRHRPSPPSCSPEGICFPTDDGSAYSFDSFGNMADWHAWNHDQVEGWDLPTDPATNRLTQAQYDPAGNVTSWFDTTFGWYPGNQMRSMGEVLGINELYGYTADGERIATYDAPASTYHVTLRDLGGKVLRLFEVSGVPPHVWTEKQDWVYRGGALLATFEGGVEKHYHLDHLGTPRLVTSGEGAWLRANDPEPFGAEPWWRLPQDTSRMQLTGHERDAHDPTRSWDDVYYMHARYYNPNIARFLSVDPGRDTNPKVPQSWNLYAYTRGNPLNRVDPNGLTDIHIYVYRLSENSAYMTGRYFVSGTLVEGYTVERPYRWNTPWDETKRNFGTVSAIPAGTYRATLATMGSYGVRAILLSGTAPRTEVFMHGAEDVSSVVGCVGVGTRSLGADKLAGGPMARQGLVDYVGKVMAADKLANQATNLLVHVEEAFLFESRFRVIAELEFTKGVKFSLFGKK
jgi:RHS repeat-associated protein